MSESNVLDNISAKYSSMTKSGKRIADYIFENKLEAQYMSITSLADECRVAEATVSRFCKFLGYGGYNVFKLALAKAGTPASGDDPGISDKVRAQDSVADIGKKLYSADISSIRQTLELLDESAISLAVDYISTAKRVSCFGQGASMIMAMEAWARFSTVTPYFQCVEDSHMQAMSASLCSAEDVILFFSYSGATKDILDVLRPARERGAKVILVTNFTKSPAGAYANVILLCGSREGPMQSGSVAAKMGQLFIIDVLFNEFCRRNQFYARANLESTANAIANKLL